MPTHDEIRDYLERSGDDRFMWDYPIIEFEGGWFTWQPDDRADALIVVQAYGNHAALLREAKKLATLLEFKKIRFGTQHKGAAMARLFGGQVIAEIVEIEV